MWRRRVQPALVMAVVLAAAAPLAFAGADHGSLPLYPGAADVEQRNLKMGEMPIQVVSYDIPVTPAQVMQFYQRQLPDEQWTSRREGRVSTAQSELMGFANGEEQLLVTADAAASSPRPTHVVLRHWRQSLPQIPASDPAAWKTPAQAGAPCPNQPCTGAAAAARQPAGPVPGHEPFYLPLYPGAVRRVFIEEAEHGYWVGAYQTSDAPEEVLAFYRRTLASFDWREVNSEQMASQPPVPPMEMLPAGAPKEAREQLAALQKMPPLTTTAVTFDGTRGTAIVSVTRPPMSQETMIGLQFHHLRAFSRSRREADDGAP